MLNFSGELNTFAREHKVSQHLRENAKFLGGKILARERSFLGESNSLQENPKFLWGMQHLQSEHKVSQGNATLLHENTTFFWGTQHICERTESFSAEQNTFARESKVSLGNATLLHKNKTFLCGTQHICERTQSFSKFQRECKFLGNAILLLDKVYQGNATLLQDKVLREMQYFCGGMNSCVQVWNTMRMIKLLFFQLLQVKA